MLCIAQTYAVCQILAVTLPNLHFPLRLSTKKCHFGYTDQEFQTSGPYSKEKWALIKSDYCVWQCLIPLNLDRKSETLDPCIEENLKAK